MASLSVAAPTDIWSRLCELEKANLACGSESAHLCLLRQRSSPVISESWLISQMPTCFFFLSTSCHT